MSLELVTVPCLDDNYAFLVHNSATQETALFDVPEAAPIQSALDQRGWTLTDVLLTHHHWDHVDGLKDLTHKARVIGARADNHRLPPLDMAVEEGHTIMVCGTQAHVLDVSGHTVGHIAFVMDPLNDGPQLAFTGDSLMAMGCGRLFEGTPAQMWDSLQKLRTLPGDTVICSGHEYTSGNMAFALSLEPDNARLISRQEEIKAARNAGKGTVPSTLDLELATNPFLRADDPALARAIGTPDATAAEVFAAVRAAKDSY